jgi:hypothetical protein
VGGCRTFRGRGRGRRHDRPPWRGVWPPPERLLVCGDARVQQPLGGRQHPCAWRSARGQCIRVHDAWCVTSLDLSAAASRSPSAHLDGFLHAGLLCDICDTSPRGASREVWLDEVRRKLAAGSVSSSNVELLDAQRVVRVRNASRSQLSWLHQTFANMRHTSVRFEWPDWRQSCEALDLVLAWPTAPVAEGIQRLVLAGGRAAPVQLRALPGAHEGSGSSAVAGRTSVYFHHDAAGCTCFTKEEAARASERLCEMRLEERVKVSRRVCASTSLARRTRGQRM